MSIEMKWLENCWPGRVMGISVAGLALLTSGCLELQKSEPTQERSCTACHGDAKRSYDATNRAAPPTDLDGKVDPKSMGVGAHQLHLSGVGHARVACNACHVVPETVFDVGHVDTPLPAEVTFGDLAVTNERQPTYDRKTRSCADTYCHRAATVDWTAARSEKDACGTCHGLPPPAPHPQKTNCSSCHGEVIGADGKWVAPERHVDGKNDVSIGGKCAACHGKNPDTGAPPPDLSGNVDASARGVGAHANHLNDGTTHRAIACSECHQVPSSVDSLGHIDADGRAEILFGTLAKTNRSKPTYDATTVTCSNTYCHGTPTANWQAPRNSDAACGSCHLLPPPLPHVQLTQCSNCHGRVVNADRTFKDPSLHVDGKVEVDYASDCSSCHGSASTPAPPLDLHGNNAPSARGVGAHANHLSDGTTHQAIACSECHQVPNSVDSPGHIDADGRAEVLFGTLAKTNRSNPSYDATTVNCSNTYCHGAKTANWQAPRSSDAACGSCHSLPPPLPHAQLTQCSNCHARVVNADRTIKDPSLHVDGKVELDYSNDCTSCHGSTGTPAPPPDLQGNTDPSARGVGAHAAHVNAGTTHAAMACDQCHVVPNTVTAPGHLDGDNVAEVTFGALASVFGKKPVYDGATAGCSETYCHGDAKPVWQAPRSSDAACGSCHALPPSAPHPANGNCSTCHAGINAAGKFVTPGLHVNGTVDMVQMSCNSCHGSATGDAPPTDTLGNQATSAPGVGAHTWHTQASSTHGVVACTECHIVPTDVNAVGHRDSKLPAEVNFGTLAKTNGSAPAYSSTNFTCSGSYCHGKATPVWNQPRTDAEACGSCHGLPPQGRHPQRTDCATCHGAVIDAFGTFIARERHVDGKVDVIAMQCNTCHGTGANGAPPPDVMGNTSPSASGVGAHQVHLQASATHGSVACNECHLVPAAWNSPGHTDTALPAEVTFGTLAKTNGSRPSYQNITATCSGSYCHGAYTPNWVAPRTSDVACGSCHALPPPLPHPQTKPCSLCHGAVIDSNQQIIRPDLHVDGQVQVVQNCTACHGSSANAAPPKDLASNSDPSRLGVGAHQLHLSGGRFSQPVACGECHVVPATITSPGHIDLAASTPADVTFSGAAAANGQNPQWDRSAATCSGSWCHGPQDPFNTSPSWVGSTGVLGCNSCHGMPPAAPHPANAQCRNCHSNVDALGNIIDRTLHINGDIDF